MRRNLDLTALRSFVAAADSGGVTRAAGLLNLTQSAVSMQLKRLEEMLDVRLFDRSNRKIQLTGEGEQLLSYARRMLELNDEVVARMTAPEHEGEIVLGVPHDIVYPVIPGVMKKFNATFPRMRVNLLSSDTRTLKALYAQGKAQIILTTEDECDIGGETLLDLPLIWMGAPDGKAWKERPLRLAFETQCIFRLSVQRELDAAGIPWEMAVESHSTRTIEATVSADMAVHAILEGTNTSHTAPIRHGGALPDLPRKQINIYAMESVGSGAANVPLSVLRNDIRDKFQRTLGRDHDLPRGSAAA